MMGHIDSDVFLPAGGASSETTLMAMPVFLNQILPVGIIGIITAGMLAGFMSTHDSYLLCWSSVLTQDVIAPLELVAAFHRPKVCHIFNDTQFTICAFIRGADIANISAADIATIQAFTRC